MAAAPASLSTSLQEMFPESRSGKMSVFARPVSDLSRGASVDDIVATTAIVLALGSEQ